MPADTNPAAPIPANAGLSITIIIPNYNGAATLERSLHSVLDQNFPRLQLLIADGGSSDGSVDIIRRYSEHIAWWVSEKDSGQSNAINKGFARATGDVVNWLCSDDLLEPGSLTAVADAFAADPALDVLAGSTRHLRTDRNTPPSHSHPTLSAIRAMPLNNAVPQPACFYRRRLLQKRTPPLDESLHYAMDLDLWCHFLQQGAKWSVSDRILATAMEDGQNKMSTGGAKIVAEMEKVYRRYVPGERVPLVVWYRWFGYPLDRWRSRHPGRFSNLAVKTAKAGIYLALAPFYGGLARTRSVNWSAHVAPSLR
jgi:hypothetical protein